MTAVGKESKTPTSMYLKELIIKGFRSCLDITIPLSPGVTLLVGENNSGKSNIIEALRLSTAPLNGRRSRYFEPSDIHRTHTGPVVVTTRFKDLTDFQRAHFIGALELDTDEVVYCTRYRPPSETISRGRIDYLVGVGEASDVEPEKREQINHVYLTPLRDAQRELDSFSGTRLARIIQYLATPDQQADFVKTAAEGMRNLASHEVVRSMQKEIQTHLTGLTSPGREQVMDAAYDPPEITRLARSLRLKMAESGIDVADLSESGLGYANLLFMATVILELQKSRESELTLFLVEEPEAHLHPQLQAVLLEFLSEQAASSINQDDALPAGRIQVIATTHSPNLASTVNIENVVVVRPRRTDSDSAVQATMTIPLAQIPLTEDERRKIDQYLDASRSELLFARRAILVEGISEAVLLPTLTRKCIFGESTAGAATARRSFAGVSIINIGSVDFKPYLKLLLTEVNGGRLADALVAVTDGDPPITSVSADSDLDPADSAPANAELELSDEFDHNNNDETSSPSYNRASELEKLGKSLGAGKILHVAEASHTLEANLATPGGDNLSVLGKAYTLQKPRSAHKWEEIASSPVPTQVFYERLRKNSRLLSKGEFAHDVARLIDSGLPFICPEYLATAIRFVVEGSKE